jgi:hypothetical protein
MMKWHILLLLIFLEDDGRCWAPTKVAGNGSGLCQHLGQVGDRLVSQSRVDDKLQGAKNGRHFTSSINLVIAFFTFVKCRSLGAPHPYVDE